MEYLEQLLRCLTKQQDFVKKMVKQEHTKIFQPIDCGGAQKDEIIETSCSIFFLKPHGSIKSVKWDNTYVADLK